MSITYYRERNCWIYPPLIVTGHSPVRWVRSKPLQSGHKSGKRARRKSRLKQPRKAVQTKMALTNSLPGVPAQATGKTFALPIIDSSEWTHRGTTTDPDGLGSRSHYVFNAGSDVDFAAALVITTKYVAKLNTTFVSYRMVAEGKTTSTLDDNTLRKKFAAEHKYEFEGDTVDKTYLGRMASTLLACGVGARDGTTGVPTWAGFDQLNFGSSVLYPEA